MSLLKNNSNYSIQDDYRIPDKYLSDIYTYPKRIKFLVDNMPDSSSNNDFYYGNLSLRQFVNGCADYILNSYMQLKIILTEDEPVIRPYEKERWADLADSKAVDIKIALSLIENIHRKIYILLNNIKDADLSRKYFDPVINKTYTLKEFIEQYINECNKSILTMLRNRTFDKKAVSNA
jgi:hypothetical protein